MNFNNEQAGYSLEICGLTTNNRRDPLGIGDFRPSFGWRMNSDLTGQEQSAYRITAVEKRTGQLMWDSGKVMSAKSQYIPYEGDKLSAESQYIWRVSVYDANDMECLSQDAFFSTGLYEDGGQAHKNGKPRECTAGKSGHSDVAETGWCGAAFIGVDEISFSAEKLPVFKVRYKIKLQCGTDKAAVLLCGNDPRLLDITKNNYRVAGENYYVVELDVSPIQKGFPASLNILRKGGCAADYENPDALTLLGSYSLSDKIINKDTVNDAIDFLITSYGGGFWINAKGERICDIIVNPTGVTQDTPCHTMLNSVGLELEKGQKADFIDYSIACFDKSDELIFGEKTGITYKVFEGLRGIKVDGNTLHAGDDGVPVKVLIDPSYGTAPMLRREFSVNSRVESAVVYATARGIYELSINGEKVGSDYFNPGYTQYDKTITYSAYDVTDMIKAGGNAIGARISSGWWADAMTFLLSKHNYFGNKPSFMAKLVINYTDGGKDVIVTDESWAYNNSDNPVVYSGFFNGETYNALKEADAEGFNRAGYKGSFKQASVINPLPENANPLIRARVDEPVRVFEVLAAKFSKETDPGVYVYDMGTNMTGIPQIEFPESAAGQKATIRYSEIYYPALDKDNQFYYGELSGKLLFENLRAALCTDTYIMKGKKGGETYIPRFTFHGYRYIEISGLAERLPDENIKGLVLSSIESVTAFYESSNPLTNQLHENIRRSLLGNHVSIPTDCPQRDERMGWTGDAQVFSRTATYYGDMNALYEGWERSIRDAQIESGWVPDIIPNTGFGIIPAVAWPAAIVIPPYECYKQYGNIRLVRDHLVAMKAFLDAVGGDKKAGYRYLTGGTALTEHLALIPTDSPLCSNIVYAYMLRIFSEMAQAVGESEIAARYRDLYEKVKQEWNETFIDKATGKTVSSDGIIQDTQASYALSIEYDIISEENKCRAAEHLARACERGINGIPYTITTGFIGTAPLLPALIAAGKTGEAYKMFEQTQYASWLYPVTQGATSIWERWNGCTDEDGFGHLNYMNSFNHYAAGAVGAFMMNHHVGIASDAANPGFGRFILAPVSGGSFTYVKGGYRSIYGDILSEWTEEKGEMATYKAVVPANTKAELYLPAKEYTEIGDQPAGVRFLRKTMYKERECALYELSAGAFIFTLSKDRITARAVKK